ncbi:carbon storage regulator [Planctomicrobium sp. SH668]|uniref:carbon storage regulator n=1 Tax=Planctomicrobium sp. SH668 TaxID=3448126 RepID=UPI003F5BAAA8
MLVLSRDVEQEIVVGDPENPILIIKLVGAKLDKAKIGLIAAPELMIHRREIAERILRARETGISVDTLNGENHVAT